MDKLKDWDIDFDNSLVSELYFKVVPTVLRPDLDDPVVYRWSIDDN